MLQRDYRTLIISYVTLDKGIRKYQNDVHVGDVRNDIMEELRRAKALVNRDPLNENNSLQDAGIYLLRVYHGMKGYVSEQFSDDINKFESFYNKNPNLAIDYILR